MGIDVVILIVYLFVIALIVVTTLFSWISRKRLVEVFRSSIRIDGYRLFLPEEMVIDIGVVRVKGFWRSSGRSRHYVSEVEVLNSTQLFTKVIELNRICGGSFYVYADRGNNVLAEAPGLVVRSGKFKDIAVLCLEPSDIPEKVVEVSVGDINESAVSVVKTSRSGIELTLTWVLSTPRQKKIVYDEKQGVYRVVEEYIAKTRARGARLEICFQTPVSRKCIPLAESDKLGTLASKTLPLKIKNKLVILHKDALSLYAYNILRDVLNTYVDHIIAGYKPGYITAKLVLDIPLARDIVKEVEL